MFLAHATSTNLLPCACFSFCACYLHVYMHLGGWRRLQGDSLL